MSLTRRFMNLARANLNALLDRVGDDDTGSLDELSDEELEAELLRRKARREREEEQRRIREQAERAARARAAATGASTSSGSSSASGSAGSANGSAGSASGSGGARPRGKVDPRHLAELYKQLEVPFGADLAEVKAAYRRLMRKYHPDRYPNDPQKAATATELTQRLAQAYRELEAALRDPRPAGRRM